MSFIRCLSNPEGLYVYLSTEGGVRMSYFPDKELAVPTRDFKRVCSAWNGWRTKARSGDFRVEEILFDEKLNRPLTKTETVYEEKHPFSNRNVGYRVGVFFKNKLKFVLWHVTWDYVVRNAVRGS